MWWKYSLFVDVSPCRLHGRDLPHACCAEDLYVLHGSSCRTITPAVSMTVPFSTRFAFFCLSVFQRKCHILIKPVWQWQPSVPGCLWALPARFSCSALSMHCNNCCPCPELKTHGYPVPIFAQQHWFCEQRGNDDTRRKEKTNEGTPIHFPEVMRKWDSRLFVSSKMQHRFSTF